MPYLLFLVSGLSGLVYQVVWVRSFGNVFGNTIHSASLVVAIFMLGLGIGSYVAGGWADRRYATRPDSLLRTYGYVELVIALFGLGIATALPHLGALSAMVSSYSREPSGWYALSSMSYVARGGVAVVLLMPISLLMGSTLTLLIRHLVRSDLDRSGWRIAVLYGVNTGGAAIGAVLTDFALVPAWGLWGTQLVAVGCNLVAGAGAIAVSARHASVRPQSDRTPHTSARARRESDAITPTRTRRGARRQPDPTMPQPHPGVRAADDHGPAVVLTSVALAMVGCAAMGMEILWFRHFTMLLGGFRAVFSLLLAVILLGIGAGSLVGGVLHRRTGHPAEWFLLVQGLFVACTLVGLGTADVVAIDAAAASAERAAGTLLVGTSDLTASVAEIWFNTRPMLIEVALPALLMGFSFPLANAIVQRVEPSVGRRAGVLYVANTLGAVGGSLGAGFVLLPLLGLQQGATVLMVVSALAAVPLYLAARSRPAIDADAAMEKPGRRLAAAFAVSLSVAGVALSLWHLLPPDHLVTRSLSVEGGDRVLTIGDGLTEIVAVTETAGGGRTLNTNGHRMSSTRPLAQRYMRALAHIPLLVLDDPRTTLVIGFGVGNTTQAVTLHPSVTRVDVADLSRGVLAHAGYFEEGNKGVLRHPLLTVHINDGRQHLQMQPASYYDLITLEPPPIGYAGVSALYSSEFYRLARSRLRPRGYISQWLPAYQVPPDTTLAMVRAFVDVFPQSVLLSGAESELLLLGTNDDRIEIDPEKLEAALAQAPDVRADLERFDLGRPHEIVGTFVGSARTLAAATRGVAPVTDDRPVQEYSVRSMLNVSRGVPGAVVNLRAVGDWCPRCFVEGQPVLSVRGLNTYLALLETAYAASSAELAQVRRIAEQQGREIAGSRYLGLVVPESSELHRILGLDFATGGRLDEAAAEFRESLRLEPDSARVHWHLGAVLAARGADAEASVHLRRSLEIEPDNSDAHNDLGLTLARQGKLDEARQHFERALALDPASPGAQRNLAILRRERAQTDRR
jgi:spermidine synthase